MIRFERVRYCYPQREHPALRVDHLALPEGCFALVVGASGAGKTTLLRCLNGLVPHFSGGTLAGTIRVGGLDPVRATPQVMSKHVGFVFQDPEAQFVVDQVEDEIAFALENAAMPRQDMRVRVEEVLDLLGLAPLRARRLETLSGGERQRVAIAAALAQRPRLLVLDEPTSQLDPKSAEDVLQTLVRLNSDLGLTVVLAEHRLERVLPFADELVLLDEGGARAGPVREMAPHLPHPPPLLALGRALGWEPLPLSIKEGRRFAARYDTLPAQPAPASAPTPPPGAPLLETRGITADYGGEPVLRGVDLAVHAGDIVALMGRNGSGKTTLLKTLVGLVRPKRGRVLLEGNDIAAMYVAHVCRRVAYVPQDPNALLFAETVADELAITLRNHGFTTPPVDPAELLAHLGLADKAHCYPRDLSTGERQRVALAALLVTHPRLLLLDEPTRGLDAASRQALIRLLRDWRSAGMALLLVTHDVELAAALAQRVVLLSQGEIIASGAPSVVLGASPLFAPQVAHLFPATGWLTPDDALAHLPNAHNP